MRARLAASGRASTAAALRASRLTCGAGTSQILRLTSTIRAAPTVPPPPGAQRARRGLAADTKPKPKPAPAPDAPTSRQRAAAVAVLEVERKFAPTALSARLLATNGSAEAPFGSLAPLGRTEFEDVYYDTPAGDLSRAGVWLRRRGGRWEAKVRVGGDYTHSAFEEVADVARISALLGRTVPGAGLDAAGGGPRGGGLREVARLVSYRSKFLVDGKFTVVIDATDFGHVVGEVELERKVGGSRAEDGSLDADEAYDRSEAVAEMDKEIDGFMKRYLWAFPPGKPVGKLSAYFALKKHQ